MFGRGRKTSAKLNNRLALDYASMSALRINGEEKMNNMVRTERGTYNAE